jgi:phage head maturation protease
MSKGTISQVTPGEDMEDLLIAFGTEIKADAQGNIKGYLVRFTDASSPDSTGDYFTERTDFGRDLSQPSSINLYYHHGMDEMIKKSAIGKGFIKKTSAGVWFEGQIAMADEYGRMIAELARKGKLGFSSGAGSHLVERKMVGDAYEITRWALAEASVTPTPAEPRCIVEAKMYAPEVAMCKPKKDDGEMEEEGYIEEIIVDETADIPTQVQEIFSDIEQQLAVEAIHELWERAQYGIEIALDESDAELLDAVLAEFHKRAVGMASVMMANIPAEVEAMKALRKTRPASIKECERRVRDAFRLSRSEAKRITPTVWQSLREVDEVADTIDPNIKVREDMLKRVLLDLL